LSLPARYRTTGNHRCNAGPNQWPDWRLMTCAPPARRWRLSRTSSMPRVSPYRWDCELLQLFVSSAPEPPRVVTTQVTTQAI